MQLLKRIRSYSKFPLTFNNLAVRRCNTLPSHCKSKFRQFWQVASGPEVAFVSSFGYGVFTGLYDNPNAVQERPFGTLFCSAVVGLFYGVSGSIVHTFIAPPLGILVPVVLGYSVINKVCEYKYPHIQNFHIKIGCGKELPKEIKF